MAKGIELDAHERPPDFMRNVYKLYRKLSRAALETDESIIDLNDGMSCGAMIHKIKEVDRISRSEISAACEYLREGKDVPISHIVPEIRVYEANDIPGM